MTESRDINIAVNRRYQGKSVEHLHGLLPGKGAGGTDTRHQFWGWEALWYRTTHNWVRVMRGSVPSQTLGYFRSRFPWSQERSSAFLLCLSSSYCLVVKTKQCFLESGPLSTSEMEVWVPILCSFLHLATQNGDVRRKQYRETFHISETQSIFGSVVWEFGIDCCS